MLKVRTFCLALLIPLLLDLLVFFSVLPTRDDSQMQIRQRSEEVQQSFRELEERSEEEEDEIAFGTLLADTKLSVYNIDFQRLETIEPPSTFQVAWAFGWKMPLRI